jgi:purine-binding chemotaxis protein CheW
VSDGTGEGLRKAFERATTAGGDAGRRVVDERVRVLSFTLGGEWYAFRLEELVEVAGGQEPTPIPFAPAHVQGVVNHRGAIVPVVDLRKVFGLPASYRREMGRMVIVRHEDDVLAFSADAISDVVAIDLTKLEPPLATMEPARARYLEGCLRLDRGILVLLSARTLVEGLKAS